MKPITVCWKDDSVEKYNDFAAQLETAEVKLSFIRTLASKLIHAVPFGTRHSIFWITNFIKLSQIWDLSGFNLDLFLYHFG